MSAKMSIVSTPPPPSLFQIKSLSSILSVLILTPELFWWSYFDHILVHMKINPMTIQSHDYHISSAQIKTMQILWLLQKVTHNLHVKFHILNTMTCISTYFSFMVISWYCGIQSSRYRRSLNASDWGRSIRRPYRLRIRSWFCWTSSNCRRKSGKWTEVKSH